MECHISVITVSYRIPLRFYLYKNWCSSMFITDCHVQAKYITSYDILFQVDSKVCTIVGLFFEEQHKQCYCRAILCKLRPVHMVHGQFFTKQVLLVDHRYSTFLSHSSVSKGKFVCALVMWVKHWTSMA